MKRNILLLCAVLFVSSAQAMEKVQATKVQLEAVKARWKDKEYRIRMTIEATQNTVTYCGEGSIILAQFNGRTRTVTTYLNDDKTNGVTLTYDEILSLFGNSVKQQGEGPGLSCLISNANLEKLRAFGLLDRFLKTVGGLSDQLAREFEDPSKVDDLVNEFILYSIWRWANAQTERN